MTYKKSGKMAYILHSISIIPMLFFGLGTVLLAINLYSSVLHEEIETEMKGEARNFISAMDLAYPGDYRLSGTETGSLALFKGDTDITRSYQLTDTFRENTGLDIALFYQDTTILSTIYNENGQRMIGNGASQIVQRDVLRSGEEQFYKKTKIQDTEYFSYYCPLKNSDGTIVGMLFVGKPRALMDQAILRPGNLLFIVIAVTTACVTLFLYLYTRKFDTVLQNIRTFLSNISTGDLNAQLSDAVLKRNDEFGDIGRSAIQMQQALRRTVEMDTLTELFNRRYGRRKLLQIMEKSAQNGTPYSVCIGDIDFFKKVNDTYGHDAGDIVLKHVADLLRQHMNALGFVARWGGEEFLLVFDRMDTTQAFESLNTLLDKLRESEIPYKDQIIHVTMTFGLSEGTGDDYTVLLKNADHKLYDGKSSGRNRVVL